MKIGSLAESTRLPFLAALVVLAATHQAQHARPRTPPANGAAIPADGQPVAPAPGTVLAHRKISNESGFPDALDLHDHFASSQALLGDLDGDGLRDLAVGAWGDGDREGGGRLWLLGLEASGNVHVLRKVGGRDSGFEGPLRPGDGFGRAVASLGDLDGDGGEDLAVGAHLDHVDGLARGAVWIVFLRPDGRVKKEVRISTASGGFGGTLRDGDQFGASLAAVGDLDGNGTGDLIVGAPGDDDVSEAGAVWVLMLAADGTVVSDQKISATQGGFAGTLAAGGLFGSAVASIGDLDGNGITEVAVGAPRSGPGVAYNNGGEIWILWLAADGTVLDQQAIGQGLGGFAGLDGGDYFGASLVALGDVDGNGVDDLAAGAPGDDDGSPGAGAVWILHLTSNGTVAGWSKISATTGGLVAPLGSNDSFGTSLAALGDLDGDGNEDLSVGSGTPPSLGRGQLRTLRLLGDQTVTAEQVIQDGSGGLPPGSMENDARFGSGVTALGDIDGNGVGDLAVGARLDSLAHGAGVVWVLRMNGDGQVATAVKLADPGGVLIDFERLGRSVAAVGDLDDDGVTELAAGAYRRASSVQPDYLRGAIWMFFLQPDGTVSSYVTIELPLGLVEAQDHFAAGIASVGDLDGDGVPDLVAGAPGDDDGGTDRGALWVLFLNASGTVKSHQKISSLAGGFSGSLENFDFLGTSVTCLGDLDGDGVPDLAVGATGEDDGGANTGAVWILFLQADGTVKGQTKLSATVGGLTGLDPSSHFGAAVAAPGDLDDDGFIDLAVGARLDDEGGVDRGAIWILSLRDDGSVVGQQKIADDSGGFAGRLHNRDFLGHSLGALGDWNGDGVADLIAGAEQDDDGGPDHGAAWLLFLDGVVDVPLSTDGSSPLPARHRVARLAAPGRPVSLDLAPLEAADPTIVQMVDVLERTRTFFLPARWAGRLDLTTLGPQQGAGAIATATEVPGFDAQRVSRLEIDGPGAAAVVRLRAHPGR
jgi:hypothetical protein